MIVTKLLLSVIVSTFACSNVKGSEYCPAPSSKESCCDRLGINGQQSSKMVMTASSSLHLTKNSPDKAKLFEMNDGANSGNGKSSWVAKEDDRQRWIQVDLGSTHTVTGVLLQGGGDTGHEWWVTEFRLLYSSNRQTWYSTTVMEGTFDRNTISRRYLDGPISARYVRLKPTKWSGGVGLRFDLLGCK